MLNSCVLVQFLLLDSSLQSGVASQKARRQDTSASQVFISDSLAAKIQTSIAEALNHPQEKIAAKYCDRNVSFGVEIQFPICAGTFVAF